VIGAKGPKLAKGAATHTSEIVQHAQRLFQQGQAEEAERALAPLMSTGIVDPKVLILGGLIARQNNQLDLAATRLKQAERLDPSNFQLLNILGNVEVAQGTLDVGLSRFAKALTLRPDFADAHINRTLAAQDANLTDQARDFVDAGLAACPGHPRLLAIKALILKELGETRAAIAQFEAAILSDPDRALTRHNFAATLKKAGRYEDACVQYRRAVELGMKTPDVAANWAAAALEAGNIDEAEQLYRAALSLEPGHMEACFGLTRLLWEYRGDDQAFGHFADAANAKADDPSIWFARIKTLQTYRQFDAALDVAKSVSNRHPDNPDAALVLARALCLAAQPDQAIEQLTEFLDKNPDHPDALTGQMIAHIMTDNGKKAADFGLRAANRRPHDQSIWAYLATAWAMTGDAREDWLCGYDHLVQQVDVPDLISGQACQAYAADIADILANLHTAMREPGNQSLRHGTQTSAALFDRDLEEIQLFRQNLLEAVRRYVDMLPSDAAHPFLNRPRDALRFSGSWSVRLKAGGGHHVAHFHPEGWISSAYYARLPVAMLDQEDHAGCIQFGGPPDSLNTHLKPRRIVRPREGTLVLFPSYLWHGTFDFSGQDTRLTAAFDVISG
jgi:tetratricopeptide (TPR) repeat protein